MNDEKYMKQAIKLAKKAYNKNEVPVGSLIVKDNKIIATAYNKKESKKNSILHAEIIAINKACRKLKTWHLENYILYTTLEPCMMCTGAIEQSRIKKIVYGIENFNCGYLNNLKNVEIINLKNNECSLLLKKFFKSKR